MTKPVYASNNALLSQIVLAANLALLENAELSALLPTCALKDRFAVAELV